MDLSTSRASTNVRLANVGTLIQSAGMFKKRLTAILWFFTGWTVGAMAALAFGASPLVGPIVGVLAALAVSWDPAGLIWNRQQAALRPQVR